jgi:hypothetical protein
VLLCHGTTTPYKAGGKGGGAGNRHGNGEGGRTWRGWRRHDQLCATVHYHQRALCNPSCSMVTVCAYILAVRKRARARTLGQPGPPVTLCATVHYHQRACATVHYHQRALCNPSVCASVHVRAPWGGLVLQSRDIRLPTCAAGESELSRSSESPQTRTRTDSRCKQIIRLPTYATSVCPPARRLGETAPLPTCSPCGESLRLYRVYARGREGERERGRQGERGRGGEGEREGESLCLYRVYALVRPCLPGRLGEETARTRSR